MNSNYFVSHSFVYFRYRRSVRQNRIACRYLKFERLNMLGIEINRTNYEYDVHSIVKAFFPEEQIRVITPDTKAEKKKELERNGNIRIRMRLEDEAVSLVIDGRKYEKTLGSERENKREYKDACKAFLYLSLCVDTKKELPWGNLTGIRPTKIAYGMLEEGKTEDEIMDFLRQKHYVSEEKGRLSIGIAKREKELLSEIHYEEGYSLYIGIPFCPTTCLYCSFTSYPIGGYRNLVEEYIDCLIQEMEYVAKQYHHKILDTVYIGGGTPTTLEAGQLDRLISNLKRLFDFSAVKEFTVEAGRADSITREKLDVLYRHQVSRISINPQTMKQETLDIIGRRHTVEQVEEAFKLAREVGFDNINMDLILGLPGETKEDVIRTIEKIKEYKPDSLTVHSLAIKRASRLNQWILEHGVSALNNTEETMEIAAKGAESLGMEPYYLYRQKNMSGNFENVGYAVPGKFGIYNILIMEEKQTIMALGAGSITKLVLPGGRIERCDNIKDVALYIQKINEMIERKKQLFNLEDNKECVLEHSCADAPSL